MKKKFLNSFLLMSFVVASVSNFVACKDYDEDIYVDIRGRLDNEVSLRQALDSQVSTLQAAVDQMKRQIAELEQAKCKCTPDQYLTKDDLAGYVNTDMWKDLTGRVTALETAKNLLQTRVDSIVNALNTINDNYQTLSEKVIVLDQQVSAAEATAQAAQDKANSAYDLAQEALQKAQEALDKAGQGGYDDTELRQLISDLTADVTTLKSTVEAMDTIVKDLVDRMQAVENEAATALNTANSALSKANTNASDIATLKDNLAALTDIVNNHINNAAIHGGSGTPYDDTDLRNKYQDLLNKLNALTTRTETIENNYATKQQVADATALAEKANAAIASLRDSIDKGNIVTLGQLRDSLSHYVSQKEFKDSIAVLRDSIDKFSKRIANVEKAIDSLTSNFEKMITGLIVQATVNPVVGYLNMPLDVRSTLLSVYYGKPTADWQFPSMNSANYVNATDINMWTARNVQILGSLANIDGYLTGSAGEILVTKDGDEGNAGTLYLTVNPANVDFTGKELALKDTKDDDALVTLSPLEVADEQLTFGWTRAAATNGFYKANATLTKADVAAARINVNFKDMEDDLKAMVKNHTKGDVLQMGITLLRNIQNVTPAYAVMGSWKDAAATDDSGNPVEHKVYSQYNLAAAAITPLSFTFMNGYNMTKFPGIDRVQSLVDEVIDKIEIKINLNLPDFAKYKGSITFTDVTLPTISDDMFRIQYKKTYTSEDLAGEGKLYGDASNTDLYFLVTNVKDGRYALVSTAADGSNQKLWIYDSASSSYHEANAAEQAAWGAIEFGLTVDVDINKTPEIKQTLQDIIDSLNDEFGAGSDLATNITSLLNDVASLGKLDTNISSSITDTKKNIKSQVANVVTKINNRLTYYVNNLPSLLHLALIGSTSEQAGLLSRSMKTPTKASSSLTLMPTTFTLEMFAPAYKKYVGVTDVFNADGTGVDINTAKSMAQAANGENMGKVVEGDVTCTLNKGQSGYIYEITYTAIDYLGKVAIRKYYVKFQ